MKIYTRICLLIGLIAVMQSSAFAQISVSVDNPTNTTPNLLASYTSLADAITALSGITAISGPVTLTAGPGSETAPAGGYVISFTATTTATNTVTILGSFGPTITASPSLTAGNLNDAIFKIIGSDYVTIRNFTMQENAANTTTAAATNNMTEWGVALLYATSTNGAQNCTIRGNTISLNRTYQNTFGIYSNSTHTAAAPTSSATATTTAGGNSGLTIWSNNISNVNNGIVVVGPTAAADHNELLDIGGSDVSTGNTISNYGTTGTFSAYANVSGTIYGVLVRNTRNFNVSYNSITSSTGGATAGTMRAIYVPSFSNAPTGTLTNTITDNTISLTHGASATMQGITVETTTGNATSSLTIDDNNFTAFTCSVASSGAFTAISDAMANLTTSISGNRLSSISTNTSGSFTFISHSLTMPAGGSTTINGNQVVTSFQKTTAGGTITFSTTGASSVNGSTAVYTNNVFSNISATGATAITGISSTDGLSSGTSTKTVTGNEFSNWTNGGASTLTGMSISYFHTGAHNISSNTISNLNGQSTITAMAINASANAATSLTISSNTISSLSSTGSGGTVSGITCSNTSSGINIHTNAISSLSSTGLSSSVVGISITGAALTNVYNNTISALSSSGTTSPALNGVSVSAGTTVNVYKNKIYDFNISGAAASTTVTAINGIVVTGGTTVNVYNNLVGDLKAPLANMGTVDAIRGISINSSTTGSTRNVYYNTVQINASSTGTNFKTAGVFHQTSTTATTSVLNLRNNIIYNTSTAAGTGTTAAYRRSAGTANTLANYGSASNNNLFYAGTPSSTNLIYDDGTSTAQTITAYKTGVFTAGTIAPRDAASVSEDPAFQSTAGANANFLKYDVGTPKQLESGATNISGYTDDYFGTIRQGNGGYSGTGTAPDMGGWELEGTAQDLVGPTITYTTIVNTSCLTDRSLTPVTVTDASSVNTTAGTRPRMYYRKSTNANTYVDNTNGTDGWKYVEAAGAGGSPFSFTTNYSLLFGGAPTNGDVIEYFVVAQDLAPTPNVGINNGTFAATPTSVALTSAAFPIGGTINSYTLVAVGLSGTVTIGAAETYTSLTGASGLFNAINTSGLSANLTVNIVDASVAETGATALNAINYNGCAAGPYTLTIKPSTTATLTGAVSSGSIIKLNGADYVTIDGSNSGGSDRSLTIANTTTTTSGNAVVWLASPASGNGATNNTIKNCIIEGNSATTTYTGVHIGGSTTVSISSAGTELNSNNTINNNLFRKTQYGATLFGYGTSTPDLNNAITNNNFGTATSGEGFFLLAINADRQNGLVVAGNEVQNVTNSTNTSSIPFGGIRLLDFKNGLCYNNNIHDLAYTGTSTPKIYGIAVTSSTYTTSGNPSNAQIYNNMVSRITSTGVSAVWNTTGILASAGYGDKFYYNTVNLTGQVANSSSGLVAAFANGDGNITTTCTNIDVRNNIFSLTGSSGTAGGNFWAYYTTATTLSGSTLNYNDLYCNGTNATNNVGRFNATNYATLPAWQTATSQDANSFAEAITFVSNSDAHINMGLTGTRLEQGGTTIAGITTDIDGHARPGPAGSMNGGGTIPDVGADEFDGVPASPLIYVSSTVDQVTGAAFTPGTNQEIIRIKVVTSGSIGTLAVTNFDLNANGTTAITDINAATAKVYYTGASTTFSTATLFGATTPTIATFSVTGSQNLLSGDNYFWLAYDVIAGATDGNLIDGECTSITVGSPQTPTVTAPSGSRIIAGAMNGNYNVGSAETFPNFATLTSAVSNLNNRGVAGPVTLTLVDANYSTSETFPIVMNQIAGANSTNTITIKPGTSVNATITGAAASAALIKLNGADYVIIDGSNNGSTSKNLTITNSSTTSPSVLWLASLGGAGAGAQNNTVKNCILSTATNSGATSVGIAVSNGTTINAGGDDNDNNTLQNNTITGANVGIYANGNAAVSALGMDNVVIEDNSITINNTITTAYGIRAGNSVGGAVTNNTVSVTTTASTAPVGIALESGYVSGTCNDNQVGPVTTSATGGYGGRGIVIGTGSATSAVTVANNEIFGMNGSNWTGFTNSSSMGICLGATPGNSTTLTATTGGINLYFNSVNLYGNHSFTSATITAGIYVGSAASALDIRNNVFVNNLLNTTTSGSKDYGIYSAAANTAYTTINNNDYFGAATGNSTFLVGFLGSDQATLGAWQTASGQDAASVSTNPNYNSDTNLKPQIGSPLIGAGAGGTGITVDRIGVSRNPTPTIGAYEDGADTAVPTITYTALGGTCATTDRMLTATIADASGVPTTGALQPRIYFRKNAGAWFSGQGTLSSGTGISGTWNFTIVAATMGGLSIGDQVQYYVIAQDVAASPNITSNPAAGLVATDVNTVTTHPTSPASFNIQNTLTAGTYTVGSGGNYATLTAAVAAYNASCLTGPVVFELTSSSYSGSETFPITITANPDASASNKLTIRPATGVTAAITGSLASNALIRIQGNYVVIDGSNNGTTTRNLTIENTSTTSPNVVLIASTGTTPVTNDTLKNCILTNGINSSSALLVSDGTTIGNDGYFNNIALINNQVRKAYFGIYVRAAVAASNGSGLLVKDNNLAATGTDAIRYVGIYVQGVDGGTLTKNTIGNFDGTSDEDDRGFWLATGAKNITVEKNTIDNLVYTGTAGYGGQGIVVTTGLTSANINIVNNMISGLSGDGWSYTSVPTDNPIGIVLTTTGTQNGINVFNNSINMTGSTLNQTSALSMGIYLSAGTTADLRNNIIVNDLGLFSATGFGTAGVYAVTSNTQFTDINYNDYSVNPAGTGVKEIGRIAATGSTTLAAWQTATGKDANSLNIAPTFVAANNLHLSPASNSTLFDKGTNIAGITTDIDDQARHATTPDVGADEFSEITLNLTAFIEGYYLGGSTMQPVLQNSGVSGATGTQCDTITVELRDSSAPYAVFSTVEGVLNTDGTISCKFPSQGLGNSYFIALKHRNSIETWSGNGADAATPFSTVTTSYNFSTAASQAYGSNMKEVETGVWAIYSGDIDLNPFGDGEVNLVDYTVWEVANDLGTLGYDPSDLNGDGEVNLIDYTIWEVNNDLGVILAIP